MNIVGCLDRPTAGHYFLDAVDVSGLDRDEAGEPCHRDGYLPYSDAGRPRSR